MSEKLYEEFARLVREHNDANALDSTKEEAWNLIADFALENAASITAALLASQSTPAPPEVGELDPVYDRGRRDMLNALLALNPRVAQRLHMVGGGTEETFNNHEGRILFDVVFWVTEVAEQLGIQPKDEIE